MEDDLDRDEKIRDLEARLARLDMQCDAAIRRAGQFLRERDVARQKMRDLAAVLREFALPRNWYKPVILHHDLGLPGTVYAWNDQRIPQKIAEEALKGL